MKTLSRGLVGTALAGMLLAGGLAAPASASDRDGRDGWRYRDDGKINVVLYKEKKKGHDKEVEHKDVKLHEAVKIADRHCDESKRKLEYLAYKAEKYDTKVDVCKFKKNKNTWVTVKFEDNKDKKEHRGRH